MAVGPNQLLARERLFQNQLAFGQLAETDIARWLLARGNMLLPIYDKEYDTGKGPRIFFQGGEFVAPDFLVLKGGERLYWIEAKHKTVFTWHRITSRWTTGIDKHHYEQYCQVRKVIGFPVWLLFLHECSKPDARDLKHGSPLECPIGLFGGDIERLKLNHDHKNWGRTGMVYWAHEDLQQLATLDQVRGVAA